MRPLAGFTVSVTADPRRDALTALLRRRGARVVTTQVVRVAPLPDDAPLRRATLDCVAGSLDAVVATTDGALRSWLCAADGWGQADALRSRLAAGHLVAPARAARSVGLVSAWSPAYGSDDEVLDHLLDLGVAGRRVALYRDADPEHAFGAALRAAGADVVEVPAYRWAAPADPAPLRRLVDLIADRLVDAAVFTSAPAVGALLHAAGTDAGRVLDALRTDVLAACPGRCAAAPLRELPVPVPVAVPSRARLETFVDLLATELPRRARTLCVAGTPVTLRGHAAIVGGVLRPLAPGPMAVLRALADRPGKVLSRAALRRVLPRSADEHAVEMAVARLRNGLGGAGYVQTVVKRGYRLPVS
ncbi:uroporphyrinogen-III synthase [Planosporangium thailandense]|uniref:Uroporphyrinogen-III synthase n=1 Tax=Planosporangium thailandense TaxID=765197 RepID=A0ABX0XY04_9ACTN|nr:uroporphyrinogen-III synthase [Planosporangium thailandense]